MREERKIECMNLRSQKRGDTTLMDECLRLRREMRFWCCLAVMSGAVAAIATGMLLVLC